MTRLSLISPITPGAEAAEADAGSIEAINVYVDKLSQTPVLKTRPGLVELNDTGDDARVDVYYWTAKKYTIVVCASKIYYKTSLTGALVEITGTANLGYNAKILFADNEYGIMLSSGLGLVWWNGTDATVTVVDDDNAPLEITSLTYLKGYIIAGELNSQDFAWATYAPTDDRTLPPVWSAFRLSASASPDNLIILAAGWEELFLLGGSSFESQYVTGDPTVIFKSLAGSAGEKGIVNNKVLQKLGDNWIYMTPNREVVVMKGRVPQVISDPIMYILEDLDNWDDVEAFTLFKRFYVLNFRSENITFVFDIKYNLWYRWEFWDTTQAKYTRYLGVTSTHAKSWGRHIVGGFNGKIFRADYKTVTDDGNFIRGKILSANIDRGTLDKKFVREIRLRIRRGY